MVNVWITASAGSGKTKALIDRILQLLLAGGKGILCLTFTNAAANEMLERVSAKLRKWVLLSEIELVTELNKISVCVDTKVAVNYARNLFCNLPKLLQIQTIHSFCYQLINYFSHEAGIAHNPKILDYKEFLYKKSVHNFLCKKLDLGEIAADLSVEKLCKIFEELLPTISDYESYLLSLKKLKREVLVPDLVDYSQIIKVLSSGSKRDKKHGELLQRNPEEVFLNKGGSKKKISSIITNGLLSEFLEIKNVIYKAQENFHLHYINKNKLAAINRTESILKIINKIFEEYKKLKKEYISYDEIIKLALRVLKNNELVMLALSNKIEHILVDEAQDNSVEQWEIIRLLSEDFFSDYGSNNIQRSIFVVGDVKQSIYSFQGAKPELFYSMQRYFAFKARKFGQELIVKKLEISYRSASPILQLVDKTFNKKDLRKAVSFSDDEIQHFCYNKDWVGTIEILSGLEDDSEGDNKIILAKNVGNKISDILSEDKSILPSDIMVLVLNRNMFIHYLIFELHQKNIEVNGYDRFILTNHIIIKDFLSLGKVLLDPENSFELVKILKSPICNLTENDIFLLCYDIRGKSVWQNLQDNHFELYQKINDWRNKQWTTFEIYCKAIEGQKYIGSENSIIEKFLDIAFLYPILSEFIEFMESNKIEVKNDLSEGVDIRTVHSSKGLEAPIVFLIDFTEVPAVKSNIVFYENQTPLYLQGNEFFSLKEKLKKEMYNEYVRLLYVAITRTKNKLYIACLGGKKSGCWCDILSF